MKIVIDIPDEAYELLKNKQVFDNIAESIIANGKPYEERPKGEWIYDNILNNWKCSECGETPKTIGYVGTSLFMKQHFKFCNHCGADMRGDKT